MSGIDYKYTGKTNRFFNNGTIYSVVADNVGHQSTTDERTNEHDLSDDYLNKNFAMLYTQAMCDAGTLPLVGMECLVVDSSLMNHEYEKCEILFIGIHKVVYTSESCIERFSNLDEVNFKPIVPPIELFNGRYYGFNYKDGLWCGIYNKDDNKFYFTDSFIVASHCTNITLLTPEVKS